MSLPIPASAPLDVSAVATNLGILIAAVAAVIAGIYTGWQKVKKSIRDEGLPPSQGDYRILNATITETVTMTHLSESNRSLCEAVRHLDATIQDLVEITRDNKRATEGQAEEAHRLRIAVKDLYEQFRASGVGR